MGLFDGIPDRSNGDDIIAAWFNTIKNSLNSVFDAFTLNDISDVTITAPTNNQVPTYNSVSGKWENKDQIGGGGGGLGQLENIGLVAKGTANWSFIPPMGDVTVQESDSDFAEVTLSQNRENGFTFTPSLTGELKFISMGYVNRGSANGDGVLRINTYLADGSGHPTGPIIETSTTTGTGSIGTNIVTYGNFIFGSTTYTSGVTYCAMLESTDSGLVNARIGDTDQVFSKNVLETGANTGVYADDAEQRTFRHRVIFDNIASGGSLILSDDMFISVPNLLHDRHTILAQTLTMDNNQVAYVEVNRAQGGQTNLTVTVDLITNVSPDGNKLIFAQVHDGECYFGIVDMQRIESGQTVNLQQSQAYTPVGSVGTPQEVTAAGGVVTTNDRRQLIFTESDGGAVDITASPQITAGTFIGQEIVLVGTSDTDFITLEDGDGLALNGSVSLRNNQSIQLLWNDSVWQETARR
jgi:hypothetical protein